MEIERIRKHQPLVNRCLNNLGTTITSLTCAREVSTGIAYALLVVTPQTVVPGFVYFLVAIRSHGNSEYQKAPTVCESLIERRCSFSCFRNKTDVKPTNHRLLGIVHDATTPSSVLPGHSYFLVAWKLRLPGSSNS